MGLLFGPPCTATSSTCILSLL